MGKKVNKILELTEKRLGENRVIPEVLKDHPIPSELRNMKDEVLGAILTEDKLDENSHQLISVLVKLTYVAGVMEGKKSVMDELGPKVELAAKLAEDVINKLEKKAPKPKGIENLGVISSIKKGLSFGKQKEHNKGNAKRKESNGGK